MTCDPVYSFSEGHLEGKGIFWAVKLESVFVDKISFMGVILKKTLFRLQGSKRFQV